LAFGQNLLLALQTKQVGQPFALPSPRPLELLSQQLLLLKKVAEEAPLLWTAEVSLGTGRRR
jgi:hypothetical protein